MPIPDLLSALPTPTGLRYRLTSPSGDEIAFNRGSVDSNGVEFYVSRLDGWDSAEVRTDQLDRPRDHGLYLGDFHYSGRILNLIGWLYSPGGIEPLRIARDRLLAAVDNLDTFSTLHVDETIPRQVQGRRAGRVGLKQSGKHLLEYDLALLARDPRRYSDQPRTVQVQDGQTVPVSTLGTFRAGTQAVITLTPSGAGPMTLTESTTGQTLRVSAGAAVVFDSDQGTVTSGSALAWGRVTSPLVFLTLPPAATLSFTAAGGAASIVFRDAWS